MHHVRSFWGQTASPGAAGMDPLVSHFSGQLSDHQIGVNFFLSRRIAKARALIEAIGRWLPSASSDLALGGPRFSTHAAPFRPMLLLAADTDNRSARGRLLGAPLSDDDWRLASLGITSGGIGARSASEHAPAACVGSFSA